MNRGKARAAGKLRGPPGCAALENPFSSTREAELLGDSALLMKSNRLFSDLSVNKSPLESPPFHVSLVDYSEVGAAISWTSGLLITDCIR